MHTYYHRSAVLSYLPNRTKKRRSRSSRVDDMQNRIPAGNFAQDFHHDCLEISSADPPFGKTFYPRNCIIKRSTHPRFFSSQSQRSDRCYRFSPNFFLFSVFMEFLNPLTSYPSSNIFGELIFFESRDSKTF